MGNILFFGGLAGMGIFLFLILIFIPLFRNQRKKLLKRMEEE